MTSHENAVERLRRRTRRNVSKTPEPLREREGNKALQALAFTNINRKMEMLGLAHFVVEVLAKTHDRFFFRAIDGLRYRLDAMVARDFMSVGFQSGGPHDMIFDLLRTSTLARRNGIVELKERLSYRENARPSLQVVLGKGSDGYWYGDADLDLSSPTMDLIGFFTHLAEVIMPGATNHANLQKKIAKQYERWSQFLPRAGCRRWLNRGRNV